MTGNLPLNPVNQILSHNVSVTMTTEQTTISLDDCETDAPCQVTLKLSVIGSELAFNSVMWIGGLGTTTSYIRSKVATTNGFQGCIAVSTC